MKREKLETAKNPSRSIAVKATAKSFNRSEDWVYKVLRGGLKNKHTEGVRDFYGSCLKFSEQNNRESKEKQGFPMFLISLKTD